jgi:hypothetical protein
MNRVGLCLALAAALIPLATAEAAPPAVVDRLVHADTGVGEPEIAVDPRHPGDVVVGENNTGVSVSHDRGLTWKQVAIANQGDNATTIDAAGHYVYTSLDGDVQVSTDRGDHWRSVGNWVGALSALWSGLAPEEAKGVPFRDLGCNAPVPAGPVDPLNGPGLHVIGCDRPWIGADATRPGHLYVLFTDHSDGSGGRLLANATCKTSTATNQFFTCGRQYVTASHDGGTTWSPFVPVDSATAPATWTNGFAGVPLARDGVLSSAYLAGAFPGSTCTTCLVFQTSQDDGRTWTRHLVPAHVDGTLLGAHDLNPLGISSSLAFEPYLAQDPSRSGRYAVMVFDSTQTHLMVQVTSDFGRTWSRPVPLAEPGGVQRWLPWIAYGTGGALGVMWRTTAADGSYSVWAAVSPTGGAAFARPVRLSSKDSPGPVSQVAGDDASTVALGRTTLHAAWGDRREGSLGIHYARYSFATDPVVRGSATRQHSGALAATGLSWPLALLGFACLLVVGARRRRSP